MHYTVTIWSTDRDNNSSRWSYHTTAVVNTIGLLGAFQLIADTISAISDARITRIIYTARHVVPFLDRGTPGEGRMERSGLFFATSATGSIYSLIVPAIASTTIATSGLLAGILLTPDAITTASTLIATLPVLNDDLTPVVGPFVTGSVVS